MLIKSYGNLRSTSLLIDEMMKLIKRYCIVISIFFVIYLLISNKNRLFPRLVFGQFHLLSTEINRTINIRQSQLYQHETSNGGVITLYDVTQDNEWDFQCPKTKYNENDIHDVRICIYDPQHDEHVSGQLNDHGKWEPVVVRSFLRLLRQLPNTRKIKSEFRKKLKMYYFRCYRYWR
jgi:hypothetical protein